MRIDFMCIDAVYLHVCPCERIRFPSQADPLHVDPRTPRNTRTFQWPAHSTQMELTDRCTLSSLALVSPVDIFPRHRSR